MTGSLADRTVVVTGAARGIGAGIAEGCLAAGAHVWALDTDEPAVRPGRWTSRVVDVTDAEAVEALLAELPGPVDCLVNNAGINRRSPVADLPDDLWQAVHAVNLAAPVRMVRQFLPRLRTPGASVVNVSSIRGSVAFSGDVAYIAAKGGLDAATRALAVELGPLGIRVNSLAPGAVETELNREVLAVPGHRENVVQRIPLGRIGTPEDIAGAAVFLAGDASRFVTGVVLPVDGGQLALG
ncbi:SDR family NAD(P)-dependent oxidoreductase [Streptomyces sp. NPDC058576]|uniref:SDR family NAD(P)-dependent oxidoreductase n=1 Tax=Streptomyces sp. NPDC058576 TaxID=3346547 RepID=UPI00365B3E81